MGREGWAAAIVGSVGQEWDVERRFRVTEVALAIMWVCTSCLDVMLLGISQYVVQLDSRLHTNISLVLRIRISFLFLC